MHTMNNPPWFPWNTLKSHEIAWKIREIPRNSLGKHQQIHQIPVRSSELPPDLNLNQIPLKVKTNSVESLVHAKNFQEFFSAWTESALSATTGQQPPNAPVSRSKSNNLGIPQSIHTKWGPQKMVKLGRITTITITRAYGSFNELQ